MAELFGVDLSSYSAGADMDKVSAGHPKFGKCIHAIVKTTEGNSYTNPHHVQQAIDLLGRGVLVGTYHFASPDGTDAASLTKDAVLEATRAAERRDAIEQKWGKPIYLPTFLDLERNVALTRTEANMWHTWANAFRAEMHKRKCPFGVYGSKSFLAQLDFEEDWKEVVLWLAQYWLKRDPAYSAPYPDAPKPWNEKNWSFWQCGGGSKWGAGNEATWPGVPSWSDVNVFRGTLEELKTQFGAPL